MRNLVFYSILTLTIFSCGGGEELPPPIGPAVKGVDDAFAKHDPEAVCKALSNYATAIMVSMASGGGPSRAAISAHQESSSLLAQSCRSLPPDQLKAAWKQERKRLVGALGSSGCGHSPFWYIGLIIGGLLLSIYIRRTRQAAGG